MPLLQRIGLTAMIVGGTMLLAKAGAVGLIIHVAGVGLFLISGDSE